MTERKKPNNKRLILMIVLLAVVIALMWLLPDGSQPAAPATDAPKTEQTKNTNDTPDDIEATTLVKAGTQAPDFRVEMFDGTTFTLGSLRGKVVLLNFWATWCGPCKREMPYLIELEKKMEGKNITFLGLSTDEDKAAWEETVKAGELSGVQLLLGRGSQFQRDYNIDGIPHFILIDPDGKIINPKAVRPSSPDAEKILNALPDI